MGVGEKAMSESLEKIFDGDETQTEAITETPAEVEETEPTGEVEAEETQAETTEDTPPVSEEQQEPSIEVQLKAQISKAQDEKHKRQDLQRRLETIELQNKQNVETPDAYAEPDAAIAHAISKVEIKFQNKILNLSEQGIKNRYDDADTMKEHFFDTMVADNPALQAEALSQTDPYEFIYRTAKNHKELAELTSEGGVDGFKAKLEKELRLKWDAEIADKTKADIEQKIQESIPPSLSKSRAAGGNKAEVFAGQKPLSKLF